MQNESQKKNAHKGSEQPAKKKRPTRKKESSVGPEQWQTDIRTLLLKREEEKTREKEEGVKLREGHHPSEGPNHLHKKGMMKNIVRLLAILLKPAEPA